jgi:hypothetical protein
VLAEDDQLTPAFLAESTFARSNASLSAPGKFLAVTDPQAPRTGSSARSSASKEPTQMAKSA